MFKNIIVPLDGSALSEGVLPYVKHISRTLKADIQLLRVSEPTNAEIRQYATKSNFASKVAARIKGEANKHFDRVRDYLKDPSVKIASYVVEGIPAVEIIAQAEKTPDSLIAMSTHGRSGVRRWLIGSVADKVVQVCSTPLLLVRPKERSPISREPVLKNVIVPLDESKFSEQVIPHLTYLANAMNLHVILTRVTPSVMDYARWSTDGSGVTEVPPATLSEIARNVDEGAIAYTKSIAKKLTQQKVKSVEYRVLHGDPASAIVDLAAETPDSFVAMTTRGRTGFSRTALGSVADRVVRNCGEPVLLIRA